MYHTDFVCTYKQISADESGNYASDEEREMASDALYQVQFLQAFGCDDGYDGDKIASGLKEVARILGSHKEGKAFLESAFAQGLPAQLAIFASLGSSDGSRDDMMDTILRTYYGWMTMDVMHAFVCKVVNDGDNVKRDDWVNVIKQHKELYA